MALIGPTNWCKKNCGTKNKVGSKEKICESNKKVGSK